MPSCIGRHRRSIRRHRRSGESVVAAPAQPVARAGRQVDGDRRLPAAPHRQHPQQGHEHDDGGRDRQRSRPSGPASTASEAPIIAATALYGRLHDVGPLGEQDVADHRPDRRQRPDEDDRGARQAGDLRLLRADDGEAQRDVQDRAGVVRRASQPEKKNVTAAAIATVGR